MRFSQIFRRLFYGRRADKIPPDPGRHRPGADAAPARNGKQALDKAAAEKRGKWKKRR
ncbi:MAG TPA: hypothetical protein VIS03_16115 [Kiloniellaceae bacterium]